MVVRARVTTSSPASELSILGRADLSFITNRQAETFADTLESVARVDKGDLAQSVGAEGNVAGYGIRKPQRIPKMLAPHNFERFQLATRLAAPLIRIQTGRLFQRLLGGVRRRGAPNVLRRLRGG